MPLASSAIAIDSGTVLVLITLLVAPIAALAFARSGPAWQSIGKGPLAIEPATPAQQADAGRESEEMRDEVRQEVRQMLVAGNERRRRQGLEPLDVEAETDRRLADFVGSR